MLTRTWLSLCASVCAILLSVFCLIRGDTDYIYGDQAFGAFRMSEYHSFGDVTLYQIIIPQHSVGVDLIIAGFNNNDECPDRVFNVVLQPGSLPLANPYNTSFPPQTNTQSQHQLRMFSLMANNVPYKVSFYHPLAGDWYMAVFLLRSDNKKIEQQGLGGISCHYLVSCSVFSQQLRYVESLSSQSRTTVELSTEKNHTTATYRFYVPSLVKSVTFSYQDCKVKAVGNQTVSDPCPVDFRFRSNGLPTPTKPVICESNTSCSVEVEEPQQDTWYYISVDLLARLGKIAVELSLGVEEQRCTEENLSGYSIPSEEELATLEFTQNSSATSPELEYFYNVSRPFVPPPESTQTSRSIQHVPFESLSAIAPPARYIPTSRSQGPWSQGPRPSPGWCPPVIPLSSAKFGGSNPFKIFFLRSPDNSSGGLEVPPDMPVVLMFELDHIRDTGGNLIIDGKENKDDSPDEQTFITLCLRLGGIPPLNGTKISCDPDYSVAFNNDDVGSVLPWITPFPAPGVWYLSLESTCKSKTGLVGPCNSTTSVNLDISLFGCVDGCGEYGDCKSSVDMGVLYYYCKCSRGYQGWGCTDDSEAWSEGYFLSRVLLLTLSNLFFIFPLILALKRRLFVPAISYFCTLVFSSFYHSCDSGSLCIMNFNTLQFCDFFAAFMSIFLTLIAMARLPTPLKQSLEILGAFGMALGTTYNRFSLWAAAVPVGVGLTVLLISWARRWHKRRRCYPTTKWRWLLFILPGTAVIITGLCLFAFLETTDNYQYVHSAWHVTMAIGVLFLLPPRESKDKQHYNHISELVDINTLNSELVVNEDPGY